MSDDDETMTVTLASDEEGAVLTVTTPSGRQVDCDMPAGASMLHMARTGALDVLVDHMCEAVAASVEPECFHAVRRVDGEPMCGEFGWVSATLTDPWALARDEKAEGLVEYELVHLTVTPVRRVTLNDDGEIVAVTEVQ